jgi:hypothetical protein
MTAKEFWEEFEFYEKGLRLHLDMIKEKKKDLQPYSYLCDQLEQYCEGLDPILSASIDENPVKYTMIISCGGNKNLFLYVNRLVAEAPVFSNWEIKAFIQPTLDLELEELMNSPFNFPDFIIIPKEIVFTIIGWEPEMNIFDILLLLPLNLADVDDNELEDAFTIIIQEIIGERLFADRINSLSFIKHITSEYHFLELEMLQECLESF